MKFELHRALESCGVGGLTPNPAAVDRGGLARFFDSFRTCPKFLITPEALASVDELDTQARVAVCRDMIGAGVFRLPFPAVVIQTLMLKEDRSDKLVFARYREIGNDEKPDNERGSIGFECSMITEWGPRGYPHKFYTLPVAWTVCIKPDSTDFTLYTKTHGWYSDKRRAAQVHDWIYGKGRPQSELVVTLLSAFLLLISTRGVVKTEVQPSERSRKLALLRRKTPVFTHTVIDLDPKIKHLSGRTYTQDGRVMPRLHWRRGHERRQRVGPGRSEVRVVWVSAHMVGHDSEGIVIHDYSLNK